MGLFLVSVFGALGISALCSLLEATLLSYGRSQVANLSLRRPALGAIWQRFQANIERPIAVILLVNTAAHTIGATFAGARFELLFGERWLIAFSLLFTYFMLQFTEILPKTLGVRYNHRLAPIVARPLDAMVRLLSPMLDLIHWINRPFSRSRAGAEHQTTLEEISALAGMARVANLIDPDQERMIRMASRLSDIRVRQIMTPRSRVDYLAVDSDINDLLHKLQASAHTRLPLCEGGDLDRVIGQVHLRDVFNHLRLVSGRLKFVSGEGAEPVTVIAGLPGSAIHVVGSGEIDLRKVMRPALFVPEQLSVPLLLQRFRESRLHLAVVVSEHGATEGVVTMEDALEQLVGDIKDEFDRDVTPPLVREGDTWRCTGGLPTLRLQQELSLGEEEIDELENVETVGGYVTQALGRWPHPGDAVRLGPYVIHVETLHGHLPGRLTIRRQAEGEATSAEPGAPSDVE